MGKIKVSKRTRRKAASLLPRVRLGYRVQTPDDVINQALDLLESAIGPMGLNRGRTLQEAWEERKDYPYPDTSSWTVGSEVYIKGKELPVRVKQSPLELRSQIQDYNSLGKRRLASAHDLVAHLELFEGNADHKRLMNCAYIAVSQIAAVLPITSRDG